MKRYQAAQSYYSRFVKLFPDNPQLGEVYYRLGNSLFMQGKHQEAINSYGKSLKISKERDILLNSLYSTALSWENLGNWTKSAETFQKFLGEYPKSKLVPLAHLKLANSLFQLKKYTQARDHYSWIIKGSEETELAVEAQYRMGDCWFNEKDYDKALVEYLRIPILYPQYKEWAIKAKLQVGQCYQALGKIKEAKTTYQEILQEKSLENNWREEANKRLQNL